MYEILNTAILNEFVGGICPYIPSYLSVSRQAPVPFVIVDCQCNCCCLMSEIVHMLNMVLCCLNKLMFVFKALVCIRWSKYVCLKLQKESRPIRMQENLDFHMCRVVIVKSNVIDWYLGFYNRICITHAWICFMCGFLLNRWTFPIYFYMFVWHVVKNVWCVFTCVAS